MNLKVIQSSAERLIKDNATVILTAGGVVGTVTTAVLAGRAGIKAQQIIHQIEEERDDKREGAIPMTKKEQVVAVGPLFIPPVLTGGLTIAAIITSHRMSAQKAAALAAAYGLSQSQFEEYRTKVLHKMGASKEQKTQDELAQDRVSSASGASQVIIVGGDDVLCFDQPTGRFFRSSMEKINRAVNSANEEIIHHDHVSANYFYEELELEPTSWGEEVGFNTENMVELSFSTVLKDDKPCLAIDFKRLPTADYMRRMWGE